MPFCLSLLYLCFVFVFLLSLKPSMVLRNACAPTATRVFSFSFFGEDVAFFEYFCTITVISFVWKVRRMFPPFRVVFSYLVTAGRVFDIRFYVIVQSIHQSTVCVLLHFVDFVFLWRCRSLSSILLHYRFLFVQDKNGEYIVRFPPGRVFLPCDHELFFFTSVYI